jgi:hypothetical protein
MQLSLLPLVTKEELENAWNWLLEGVRPRPTTPSQTCIYDHKQWQIQGAYYPLKVDGKIEKHLGILFLTSEFGDVDQTYNLANFDEVTDINCPAGVLDKDVANVIQEAKGFRDSLSEHLAFWVRLADEAQARVKGQKFAGKLPHVQSRDKGPDGLFISVGQKDYIEIQSVKNSINDPKSLVGTRSFRTSGKIHNRKKPKQLEEFWLTANENWGIVRLQRELSNLCRLMEITEQQELFKIALSNKDLCFYNAVVVADEKHAREDVFEGYGHITHDVSRRIATYISSDE